MAASRKVCMLGDFGVGKTSLVAQFVHSVFTDKYLTTVGAKIDTKEVDLADGGKVKLVVWDLAGGPGVTGNVKTYLRGAVGYLLVLDGTRRSTLESALNLREEAEDLIPGKPFVVLVNKVDIRDQWEVSDEDLVSLRDQGLVVFESSAKTGQSVEEAFAELAQKVA